MASAANGFGRLKESVLFEDLDRPVNDGAAEGENITEKPARREGASEVVAVLGTLPNETQTCAGHIVEGLAELALTHATSVFLYELSDSPIVTNNVLAVKSACRVRVALLVIAIGTGVVAPTAHSAGYSTTPTVNWLASSAPTSSKIDLARIVAVDSIGRRTVSTAGSCSIKGSQLVTAKQGACRIAIRIGATSRFAAASSSTVIQIRKPIELNVLAAASLSAAFGDIGTAYMSRFLNVSIRFNFAGSSTLATQIQQGAPVDVVAMADTTNMDKIVASGQVQPNAVTMLARNKLAILVQRGNPSKITSLNDLTRSGLKVVLCDVAQPCGKYAATVLSNAKIALTPASREASASGIVSRIANGEADAGIAYVTDGLISGDKVDPVTIPDSVNVVTTYPIAGVKKPSTKDTAAISTFIALAQGPVGKVILAKYGFIVP